MRRHAKTPLQRRCGPAAVSLLAALAFCTSARAEGPFAFEPGSFATSISTNQAGAHPDLRTRFNLATNPDGSPAGGSPRNIHTVLPRGLFGASAAAPTCSVADAVDFNQPCPAGTKVGISTVTAFFEPANPGEPPVRLVLNKPVYNIEPYPGEPAAFAFSALYPVRIDTHIRADGDYGVTVDTPNLTEAAPILSTDLVLWGVPADHNGSGGIRKPFMTNPTECSGNPLTSSISIETWQLPTQTATAEYSLGEIAGCDKLQFSPTISALPTTNLAGSPSGLDFNLEIPQNEDPDGNATAHLKDANVTLPAGMTINPSAANGLRSCSPAEAGISASGQSDGQPVNCPNASKLGSVEAISPAVDHALPGALYLAAQGENPFGSLLALYLVIEDPLSGIFIKLAGKAEPDPGTGQLTVTFENSPQLPLQRLSLSLFGGPRAALRTPATCGPYTTTSTFTPWSAPAGKAVSSSSSFAIDHGPSGGSCLPSGAAAPNNPTFTAGTLSPSAKAFSPFVLKMTRADGSQPLRSIDTTLPKGLIGRLADIPYCSDGALATAAGRSGKAEQASPSCPGASQVGSVDVGAGAGTSPVHISGKTYLAGPYKGAPLSLAVITPAVAGPLDLGTVAIRVALDVDPETAQVHAVSDPIPTILQGIPLEIRSIALSLDKPDFTLNPTSCSAARILARATSVFDQSASLSNPFQVGDCPRLGFEPRLGVKLSGPTHRSGHPRLRVTLGMPTAASNLAEAAVTLPKTELLAGSHIRSVCTRLQFDDGACPVDSVYGHAAVFSPLLDGALSGPVYLRANSANRLPDLVASLDGQVHLDLVGRLDSPRGRIRASFKTPDVPLRRFTLALRGGDRGLIVNTGGLCRADPPRARGGFAAQSGATRVAKPRVQVDCPARHAASR